MKVKRKLPGRFLLWLGLALTLISTASYSLQFTPAMAEFDPRQVGLLISLAGMALSVWGFAREIRQTGVTWEKSLGAKILSISLVLVALYVSQTFFAFHEEEVRFRSGDVVLAGTLLIPNGEGPHPALVMMHGAGEATRMGNFAEAQFLARRGVAAFIYDKRGSGASVGGHYRFDGYEALANDGAAAFNFLKNRSDIDPNQIGLWGPSEGGWTAPMTAAQVDKPAFLIIVSGGPLTVEEQGMYSMESDLRLQGFSDEAINQALALNRQENNYIRTGQDRNELLAAVEQAKASDWFETAYANGLTIPPYNELPEYQRWERGHLDTNVIPLLEQMNFPILYVLGADDPKVPALQVKAQVESIFEGSGHTDFAVKVFPKATHNIIASAPANCVFCVPDAITGLGTTRPWFAPGYLGAISEWVTQRVTMTD